MTTAVTGGIVALVLAVTGGNGEPAPITRAELMAEYARITPMDRSATPETIDETAVKSCELLNKGMATDRIISVSTDSYGARATQVIRLLVSYKCPQYLAQFK